ncbi:MAG: hypothetical protein PF501_14920 [Salinisphaera sp.]|nr:hypothetical protein [Salinisphaera sp.]
MGDSRKYRRRWILSVAATGSLLAATSASALEFGQISLNSQLNQPLAARIVLSSLSSRERDSLSVRVASPAMFKRFGIERSSDVDNLDITTVPGNRDGQVVVRVRTKRPVREPFIDFLLEASTSNGSALREYTVLLNPAGSGNAMLALAADHGSLTGKAGRTGEFTSASPRSAMAGPPGAMAGVTAETDHHRYGPVTAGETLFSIAVALKPSDVTVPQMEAALFDANPQAFSAGMNSLLRGTTLSVPPLKAITRLSASQAQHRVHVTAASASASAKAALPAEHATVESVKHRGEHSTQASGQSPPRPAKTMADNEGPVAATRSEPSNATFGRLSTPPESVWAQISATTVGGSSAASATTGSEPRSPASTTASGSAGQLVAAAGSTAVSKPVATRTGTTAAAPGIGPQAPAPGAAPTTSRKPASVLTDAQPVTDVTEAGGGTLFTPGNLLLALLLLVAAVGAAALVFRRRQYQPVPMDFHDPDLQNDEPPADDEPVGSPGGPEITAEQAASGVAATERNGPDEVMVETARARSAGDYGLARMRLEQGLAEHPRDLGLQDTLLDVDFQLGDADRFGDDFARFEQQILADPTRAARVADQGRALLPGDERFIARTTAVAGAVPADGGHADTLAFDAPASDEDVSSVDSMADPSTAVGDKPKMASFDAFNNLALETPSVVDSAPALESEYAATQLLADDAFFVLPEDDASSRQNSGDDFSEPLLTRQRNRPDEQDMAVEFDEPLAAHNHRVESIEDSLPEPMKLEDEAGIADNPQLETMIETIDGDSLSLYGLNTESVELELDSDTVEIRLDLARMYMEMEDADMARSLLAEVVANGDDAQQRTAQSLLETM